MERAKQTSKALYELTESYSELHKAIKSTAEKLPKLKNSGAKATNLTLIKIGMACIMFPDPSPVGEIIGAGFLIAGAVQKGIQKRTLYVSDLKKNLDNTLRELNSTQCNLRT